jgi:hypothetical protein
VPAQTQRTCVQRLSPENKEVSPYIPLKAGYRSRKQSSIHISLHVTSLAISFSQCYVTFMFQFFEFYLCFAIPSPVSSAEHSLFFFFRPPPLSCYTCTCYHLAGDKGNEMYTNHTDVMFIGVRRFEDVRLIGTASCGSWEWHGVWGEQELAG